MEADEGGQRKMSPADRTRNRTRIISERLGSKPAATSLAKVWRQELQKPSRARATSRRAPSPSQSSLSSRRRSVGGSCFALFLLLFSGLRGPQGHAKLGPSWRGCDRTGAAGASPMGPGPTERDPGPGRDSTWDPLNALGPIEPGPTEPNLKPPARVVTAGSYQI